MLCLGGVVFGLLLMLGSLGLAYRAWLHQQQQLRFRIQDYLAATDREAWVNAVTKDVATYGDSMWSGLIVSAARRFPWQADPLATRWKGWRIESFPYTKASLSQTYWTTGMLGVSCMLGFGAVYVFLWFVL